MGNESVILLSFVHCGALRRHNTVAENILHILGHALKIAASLSPLAIITS